LVLPPFRLLADLPSLKSEQRPQISQRIYEHGEISSETWRSQN
jgi:hypothetical protein